MWDLEAMALAESLGPEATGMRAIAFAPDGGSLLGGSHEGLRAWAWEPARSLAYVEAGWGRLHDLAFFEGRILGCAAQGPMVGGGRGVP